MPVQVRRRTPTQERSRATVAAILEAAAQVFERRGFAGTTTDRIAERAGVSVGSLYQYFPDKHGVLEALALAQIDAGFDELHRLLDVGGSGLTGRVLQAVARVHIRRPLLHKLVFLEGRAGERARERLRERQRGFVDDVAARLPAEHPAPHRAAWLAVHAVEGCLSAYAADPGSVDGPAALRQLATALDALLG